MDKLFIGTEKGGYRLERSPAGWTVEGPSFPGWKVSAYGRTPDGTHLAALGSNWFGASVHRSRDLESWEQVEHGPSYPESSSLKLNQIWTFLTVDDRVLAGVAEAGLFVSTDQGLSWEAVPELNDYPGRQEWQPGFGGLAAHHLLAAGDTLWVGISAVGVFRSENGQFQRRDLGVTPVGNPEAGDDHPSVGRCVHGLTADPNSPQHIWRQDHSGVYRTRDGGDRWERIEQGLPARFGFAIGRNHSTGTLFVSPLTADENRIPVDGQLAVYRSRNRGDSWEIAGDWPKGGQFNGVLRNAMVVDDQGGVAIGTTGGVIHVSEDEGDSWEELPFSFPRILAVAAP